VGHSQNKNHRRRPEPCILDVPHPWALPVIKHKTKFIMDQTYVDHKAYEWEGWLDGKFLEGKLMDMRCLPHTLQNFYECFTCHASNNNVIKISKCIKLLKSLGLLFAFVSILRVKSNSFRLTIKMNWNLVTWLFS